MSGHRSEGRRTHVQHRGAARLRGRRARRFSEQQLGLAEAREARAAAKLRGGVWVSGRGPASSTSASRTRSNRQGRRIRPSPSPETQHPTSSLRGCWLCSEGPDRVGRGSPAECVGSTARIRGGIALEPCIDANDRDTPLPDTRTVEAVARGSVGPTSRSEHASIPGSPRGPSSDCVAGLDAALLVAEGGRRDRRRP